MAITLNSKHKIQTKGINNREIKDSLTVEDFIDLHTDFIREKQLENLRPRTIEDHKMLFGYLSKWLQASHWFVPNQRISSTLFLEYKEYLIYEKQYAPTTVNVRLRPIKTYINWLLKHGHINTNYNHFIKLAKTTDDRINPLSKTEVKNLLAAMGDETYARYRDYILSLLILDCGIRTTEALTLTYHDVNFKDSYVIVKASESKTRTERILPISRRTLGYLKHLKEISLEHNKEYLFLASTGENRLKINDLQHNFRRYKKEANISKKCSPYVLRHTFASTMIKQGMDVFTLQRIMGHKNITTTRQYIHLDNTDIRNKHKESGILNYFLD